ncbi:MAG: TonB C-terminal domain-containing protein [Bdellovibrionales bacterium]
MTADNFSRNVMISGLGHVGIVMLIFLRAVTMPSEHVEIRNAIRVDVVGLPQKMETLPEKVEVAPKPAPAPATKEMPKKAEPVPVKTKIKEVSVKKKEVDFSKVQKESLRKLKQQEMLEKIQKEVGKENSAKPKATVVAGNKLANGNALEGIDRIDYDKYYDELKDKLHSSWSVPQWLADADFKAKVLVLIDERGYVVKKTMKVSSGNDIFDAKAMEAVDNSSPFPAPPARLRGLLSTNGIVFNFPQ